MNERRRFPSPWTVEIDQHGYMVRDANGVMIARVYYRDHLHAHKWQGYHLHLTSDEARRIALAIARIPEFLKKTN